MIHDQQLTGVVHKLKRVITIQQLLNQQIGVMETMTPQDFMSFRDYLVPASGFQSVQFKMLEIGLGLKSEFRIDFDKNSFYNRLNDKDREFLQSFETLPSLFERVQAWLERMPFLEFGDFSFWQMYQQVTAQMLDEDQQTVESIAALAAPERQLQLDEIERTPRQIQCFTGCRQICGASAARQFPLKSACHAGRFVYQSVSGRAGV